MERLTFRELRILCCIWVLNQPSNRSVYGPTCFCPEYLWNNQSARLTVQERTRFLQLSLKKISSTICKPLERGVMLRAPTSSSFSYIALDFKIFLEKIAFQPNSLMFLGHYSRKSCKDSSLLSKTRPPAWAPSSAFSAKLSSLETLWVLSATSLNIIEFTTLTNS